MTQNGTNGSAGAGVLLVLLGGATCGGKSSVADYLERVHPQCVRLSQDTHFREEDDPMHLWLTLSDGRRHQDWEHERSIDWPAMRAELRQKLSAGSAAAAGQPRLVIVEGHVVLAQDWSEFSGRPLRFFFTMKRAECLRRRRTRTYVPADPPTYFDDHVWPSYVTLEQQVRAAQADETPAAAPEQQVHLVNGTGDLEQICAQVEKQVRCALDQLAAAAAGC